MKKKLSLIMVLCLLTGLLSGCFLLDESPYETTERTGNDKSTNQELNTYIKVDDDVQPLIENNAIRMQQQVLKGDGTDKVTILIYMNGSNLETEDGEATTDLSEIVAAGTSDKVNILVQTMGTKQWDRKYNIASNRSQRYKVDGNGLTLLQDDLGQLDCNASETLSDFIIWGVQNFPADRYILHFWDHGGGPVYGFGYDEWNSDEYASLTIDEMQTALKTAGVYFDFVGMDCCLMSCLEVCCAFYNYCDYMVLSEDFESGLGWAYTNWVKTLYENTSIPTLDLGKIICDDIVRANETQSGGDKTCMAVIDEGALKVLYTAWTDFAYDNENELLGRNFSRAVKRHTGGRVLPRLQRFGGFWNYDFYDYGYDEEDLDMAEYYITDIMEVASSIDSDKADALSAALDTTLKYVKTTESDASLTGIAVSLPYGDRDYYSTMKPIFLNIGLDAEYVEWLEKFTNSSNPSSSSHDDWDDSWYGWEQYEDDYDWSDWDYCDDDCCDDYYYGWDDWGYGDSWNEWQDDNNWMPGYDDYGHYEDDWYYGDEYYYYDDCYDEYYGYFEDYYYNDYDYDYNYNYNQNEYYWHDDYRDDGGGFFDFFNDFWW